MRQILRPDGPQQVRTFMICQRLPFPQQSSRTPNLCITLCGLTQQKQITTRPALPLCPLCPLWFKKHPSASATRKNKAGALAAAGPHPRPPVRGSPKSLCTDAPDAFPSRIHITKQITTRPALPLCPLCPLWFKKHPSDSAKLKNRAGVLATTGPHPRTPVRGSP